MVQLAAPTCGSNLCERLFHFYFSKCIYLFIGENPANREEILCLRKMGSKHIPVFLNIIIIIHVNVCMNFLQ